VQRTFVTESRLAATPGSANSSPPSSRGSRQYGDRTFDLPMSTIVAEAQAELLDNAAYSFIAWCRLERQRQELDRMRPPVGQEKP
jgi:hypothetical protein